LNWASELCKRISAAEQANNLSKTKPIPGLRVRSFPGSAANEKRFAQQLYSMLEWRHPRKLTNMLVNFRGASLTEKGAVANRARASSGFLKCAIYISNLDDLENLARKKRVNSLKEHLRIEAE
jgi:hypothetical protein